MSESFESAMDEARALMADCDMPLLDRLQAAHDREIEHARKAEYNRGYEDALRRKETDTWQLDMERAEVARHVDAVTLDGGSHANLSALAAAVYEPSGGWTSGACAMLRERLVRLLGGVSGRPYPTSTYDVLDNERHKAIANLRMWEPDRAFANDKCGEVQIRILYQLLGLGGGMMMDGADAAKDVRDRLIHLLGGDEPNLTETAKTINLGGEHDGKLMESGENHKIATITDEPTLSDLWGVWKDDDGTCPNDDGTCPNDGTTSSITDELRAELDELRGHSRTCPESGGDVSESAPSMSITDELREFKGHINAGLTPEMVLALRAEINCIADRIDVRFDRICQQQEAVLQSTIDGAGHRLEDADKRLNKAAHDLEMWHDRSEDMRMERDDACAERDSLLDLLRDAVVDFKNASYGWDYAAIVSENITMETERNRLAKERDELQAKLDQLVRVLGDAGIQAMWINDERDCIIETSAFTEPFRVDYRAVTSKRDALQRKLDAIRDALGQE